MIGVGYRRELAGWIDSGPTGVRCLEITAEHFFAGPQARLVELRQRYRLFVHGLGLSLGTPGPLDAGRLRRFAQVADACDAVWVSEHVAFTRAGDTDLGHLNPLRPTRAIAAVVADHAREVADRCGRPILLENITSHLQIPGELPETDFLNLICARADCGLLLDVTNLHINSRNHGFDPMKWLDAIDVSRIRQLHIVGYSEKAGRLADDHAQPVQPELVQLAAEVMARAPVEAVILERDMDFPEHGGLAGEISKLSTLYAGH